MALPLPTLSPTARKRVHCGKGAAAAAPRCSCGWAGPAEPAANFCPFGRGADAGLAGRGVFAKSPPPARDLRLFYLKRLHLAVRPSKPLPVQQTSWRDGLLLVGELCTSKGIIRKSVPLYADRCCSRT